ARDGGEADERADLDVVAADSVPGAVQAFHALDLQYVRADPGDSRAHRVQQVAQVLDVRLRGGVAQASRAAGEHRGHDRVLRRRDAGLVEEDVRAHQAFALDLVPARGLDARAEAGEREEMRVHTPAADHVPAGWRQHHAADAGEHRAGEQDGGADARGQFRRELGRVDVAGPETHGVGRRPLGLDADVAEQLQQRADVADVRDVLEGDRLVPLRAGPHRGGRGPARSNRV